MRIYKLSAEGQDTVWHRTSAEAKADGRTKMKQVVGTIKVEEVRTNPDVKAKELVLACLNQDSSVMEVIRTVWSIQGKR